MQRKYNRSYSNIFGGGLLVALGSFASIYAGSSYSLGDVSRMGPGMVPFALGIILCALGVALIVPALSREGYLPRFDFRAALAILSAATLFALCIEPFGLIPAITIMTVVATWADNKVNLPKALALSGALSFVAILLFKFGLSLPIAIVGWPF